MTSQRKAAEATAGGLEPLGYEQITSMSSAQSLSVPDGATMAVMVAETQDVRWRDDGTAPTGSVGMPLVAGEYYVYTGQLRQIQVIEQAASAALNVTYY